MGAFFIYIFKSAVCLALFYLFFRLLLSRETFHRFNRIALLGVLSISWLIPLIEFTMDRELEVHQAMLAVEQIVWMAETTPTVIATDITTLVPEPVSISWIQIVLLVYLGGILFFACRNIYSLGCLVKLLFAGKWEKMDKGIILVVHHKNIAPFSWMKFIVISRKDLEENGREILIHETAHIRNRHSLDLLFADICIFFLWFNPAAWLLKQELQNIHEYEADETVINEGVNAKEYQLLLIKKAVGTRLYSMANSFNHSKLKKRITMMLKEKSNPWARLKYLYVFPLAAVAVAAFARPEVSKTIEEISVVKVNDLVAVLQEEVPKALVAAEDLEKEVSKSEEESTGVAALEVRTQQVEVEGKKTAVPEAVEQKPEFPGGTSALNRYIAQKAYDFMESDEKLDDGLSIFRLGLRGYIVVNFTVSEVGKVENASIASSDKPVLNSIALRIVREMPDWSPGELNGIPVAMKCSVPIRFSSDSQADNISFKVPGIVLIDGVETPVKQMKKLRASVIDSIVLLVDSVATSPYGERGAKGVILITSRAESKTINRREVNTTEIVKNKIGTTPDFPVAGYVIDVKGKRIRGVTVTIPGTRYGVVTDGNGTFAMNAFKGGELYFSYPGLEPIKVPVSSTMKARLEPEYIKMVHY